MFAQLNSNFNAYSGYDSDGSVYSDYSNYSYDSYSSGSSGSSNSSNFTITSDPINYYMKDNLKQNPHKFFKHLQQLQQQQTRKPCNSLRKQQSQNYLEKRRLMLKYKDEDNMENNSNNNNINENIGVDSGLNKDTPFINYLINKRIHFCELGASSHIAAFIPVTYSSRYCFIRGWKGKGHYG